MIPDEVLFGAAPYLLLASLAGLALATVGYAVDRVQAAADHEARMSAREALEAVPRVEPAPSPEVEAITGDIQIVRVCPHLSTLDRLDGLRCPECGA